MTTHEAERNVLSRAHDSNVTEDQGPVNTGPVTIPGSAAFQAKYAGRDIAAGLIAGSMAIPLTVGIAMMSEIPSRWGWPPSPLPALSAGSMPGLNPATISAARESRQAWRRCWPWVCPALAWEIWRLLFS